MYIYKKQTNANPEFASSELALVCFQYVYIYIYVEKFWKSFGKVLEKFFANSLQAQNWRWFVFNMYIYIYILKANQRQFSVCKLRIGVGLFSKYKDIYKNRPTPILNLQAQNWRWSVFNL